MWTEGLKQAEHWIRKHRICLFLGEWSASERRIIPKIDKAQLCEASKEQIQKACDLITQSQLELTLSSSKRRYVKQCVNDEGNVEELLINAIGYTIQDGDANMPPNCQTFQISYVVGTYNNEEQQLAKIVLTNREVSVLSRLAEANERIPQDMAYTERKELLGMTVVIAAEEMASLMEQNKTALANSLGREIKKCECSIYNNTPEGIDVKCLFRVGMARQPEKKISSLAILIIGCVIVGGLLLGETWIAAGIFIPTIAGIIFVLATFSEGLRPNTKMSSKIIYLVAGNLLLLELIMLFSLVLKA
jgi:hypothetical protein